jgi:hypothetical protein
MILRYTYLQWKRLKLQRYLAATRNGRRIQQEVLHRLLSRNADSDFGRQHHFADIRTVADYQRQVPVSDYEYFRPYIKRVLEGDIAALFAPGTRILMFTMTSGTTGEPKYLPVTDEFFRNYREGWHLWGTGVFADHRGLLGCKALQLASDWQQTMSPSGVPCGNISGLAAETRSLISRIMFYLPSDIARIHDAAAKHYATLRIGLAKSKVGLLVTANPSTLIEFARRADQEKESLIRDIRDGTLSAEHEIPADVRAALRPWLHKKPRRAQELEKLVERTGRLHLRDAWPRLQMISVWTGGSVGVYLPRLKEFFGETAIRDHGLSASEGRMTLPIADGTSAGVMDYRHQFFEFIPEEEHDSAEPTVLEGYQLEEGHNYFILLTTAGGLYRYDIHDVVRCVGFYGEVPLLKFLNKGKNFSSVTGEKLSEHQAIEAVTKSFAQLRLPAVTFTLAPVMEDRPRYVLLIEAAEKGQRSKELASAVQKNLESLNVEYAEKCASGRILPLRVEELPAGTWAAMRHQKTSERGNFEEYKHPCLTSDLQFVARTTGKAQSAIAS